MLLQCTDRRIIQGFFFFIIMRTFPFSVLISSITRRPSRNPSVSAAPSTRFYTWCVCVSQIRWEITVYRHVIVSYRISQNKMNDQTLQHQHRFITLYSSCFNGESDFHWMQFLSLSLKWLHTWMISIAFQTSKTF